MKRYLILSVCLGILLAFAIPVHAQQIIKGTVVDEIGEPIIGASVKVEGTSTGTITDLDGHFSIQVPANGKLTISFIGYISQTISNFTNMRIVLKEDFM